MQNKEVIAWRVIERTSLDVLNKDVKEYLNAGWKINYDFHAGLNVGVNNTGYYQAIIKYAE